MSAIHLDPSAAPAGTQDTYLAGPRAAWFAFAMTIGLMVMDYVDRQVIVSLFPYLSKAWSLSDTQLGSLVSIVSVTVALAGIPVALFADRVSRVRSIAAMAMVWSIATLSCMWTRSYGALLAARGMVGLGEAGYGSVGAALIAGHFPARMRGTVLAGFFAAASVGSVLGVMLGGVIAAKWGWQAAFGVVGVPGLILAVLYLFVKDYPTVALTPTLERATSSGWGLVRHVTKVLGRSPTLLWVCIGAAAQCIVISGLWSWMPSFLNRVYGVAPAQAGAQAAIVVLAGAIGSVVWGAVADRAGREQRVRRIHAIALMSLASMAVLAFAFAGGKALGPKAQFALIAFGGFFVTCTVGPVSAIAFDVIHPGVRSTGASVLSLFQNLFGLALGPVVTGALSDRIGLESALTFVPLFSIVATAAFMVACRTYNNDAERSTQPLADEAPAGAQAAHT